MMKKIAHIIIIVLVILSFNSCEDVITVDLPTEEPRLVIDAIVRVDAEQPNTLVSVKVTETSSFFGTIVPASLQQITLINQDNPGGGDSPILFETEPGSGVYERSFPTNQLMEDSWVLNVNYQDNIFVGFAEFAPSVPIDNLAFGEGTLFDEDDTELIITFTDNAERDDFYLFDFDFGNFLVSEDEFYQGQQFEFSYFYDEDLNLEDQIEISILGADQAFADFMELIIEQSEGNFGPFETPAVTVRGNFINTTEIDNQDTTNNVNDSNNFALGYFAIVQEYKQTIIIE